MGRKKRANTSTFMSNLEPYNFFFELPLYTQIKVDKNNKMEFVKLMRFSGGIDAYNPILKENTTYRMIANRHFQVGAYLLSSYEDFTDFTLTCIRNNFTIKCFAYLEVSQDEDEEEIGFFQKVGQLPSIADLHRSKIKEYDKVLEREKIKEITRAIGLAANGVGIGSFVYLRRVFEYLVEEAHKKAVKENNINEAVYEKSRMVDKIELLKKYLPTFLVQNRSIYGILSLGIHELTEQDCLTHFEALKVGIELILDEKVGELNKERKIAEAQRKIESVNQQIKGK